MLNQKEKAFEILTVAFPTFDTIEETGNRFSEIIPAITSRSEQDGDGLINRSNMFWGMRSFYILCAPEGYFAGKNAEDLLGNIPSAAEYNKATLCNGNVTVAHSYTCETLLPGFTALALEKLGLYTKAIDFADGGCITDIAVGGNEIAWHHSLCYGCKGRSLMRLGRQQEALESFESAANVTLQHEYKFMEVLAIRDWMECIAKALPMEDAQPKLEALKTRRANAMATLGLDMASTEPLETLISKLFKFPHVPDEF